MFGQSRVMPPDEPSEGVRTVPAAEENAGETCERPGMVRSLLGLLNWKDSHTLKHSARVTALASHLATLMALDRDQKQLLQTAGLLHDVGKVAVPDSILRKKGPLTGLEYRKVQRHARIGGRMVDGIESGGRLAHVVRHHHERWDGRGYPDGLVGAEIPLLSRILAVADAFDAMKAARPYVPPLSTGRLVQELRRGRGGQFDPHVVDALLTVFPGSGRFRGRLGFIYRSRWPSGCITWQLS